MHKNLEFILMACTPNLPSQLLSRLVYQEPMVECNGARAKLIWHIPLFAYSCENAHLTPDPTAICIYYHELITIGSGLKCGHLFGVINSPIGNF